MFVISLHLGIDCSPTAKLKSLQCCDAEKCGENEGDCGNDDHCISGLKCGTDNCPIGFPSYYDCCYKPLALGNFLFQFLMFITISKENSY